MASHWGFSPEVQIAIEAHHDLPRDRHASPIAAAVAIACELAHHEGYGLVHTPEVVGETDRTPRPIVDHQLAVLGLERSDLHLIGHRAKRALREIDEASGTGQRPEGEQPRER